MRGVASLLGFVLGIVVAVSVNGQQNEPSPGTGADHALRLAWQYGTGGQIRSRPAVGPDGSIYALSEDGYLYAISASGVLQWKCNLGWLPWDILSVGADGTIYAGLKNRALVAVNPRGREVWRVSLDSLPIGDPLAAPDGTLYVATERGALIAYSHTGRVEWSITLPARPTSPPVMDGDGTIYLPATDGRLYALTAWGDFKWSLPIEADVTTLALGRAGRVFAGLENGVLDAVSPNGDELWSRTIGGTITSVVVDRDRVYAAADDGTIGAFSPDGEEVWRASLGKPPASGLVLDGSSLIALRADGMLVSMDATGRIDATLRVGTTGGLAEEPGSLFIGGRDWIVDSVSIDLPASPDAARASAPWPQPEHDAQHSGASDERPGAGNQDLLWRKPDYLYLHAVASLDTRDAIRIVLDDLGRRIADGRLARSAWYAVRILESICSTGLLNPVYLDGRLVNDFPDLRARAAALLGRVGTTDSRRVLIRVLSAEYDRTSAVAEVAALGSLESDPDGASTRAIAAAFLRLGRDASYTPLAAAAVAALAAIDRYEGAMPDPAGDALLEAVWSGSYPSSLRSDALALLRAGRN